MIGDGKPVLVRLRDHDCLTTDARVDEPQPAPERKSLDGELGLCSSGTLRGREMTKAMTALQRQYPPEQDTARLELARDLPPCMDWLSEARRALAPDQLIIDGNGRVLQAEGAPTGFMLDPLLSGEQVYIRDEWGTRYWLGSPHRLRAVLRWLLS